MFTGLVEGLAEVRQVLLEGSSRRLCVAATLSDGTVVHIGDSIAINGCCLTLVAVDGMGWWFQAGFETLAKTNLGRIEVGDRVNWEFSMPANGRFGGHIVQGHVDGVGEVDSITVDGDWRKYWFRVPADLARGMVPKGSVAVDGVSLTLVDVERERFSVMLIPHTLKATTLGGRQPGDTVNIETDYLGKFVLKFLDAHFARQVDHA